MQLKETEVIERETDKDFQTEEETVNDGEASDDSFVFTKSDSSSELQVESSSPSYDSDTGGTQRNEAGWDSEDNHIRPSSDTEILARVQHSHAHDNVNIFDNVFAQDQTHLAHPESISDTYVVEQNDSNITFATPDMDPNRGEPAQDGSSYEQDRALLASLINNFKHELEKCKEDNRKAKQTNVLLTKELERFKEMEKGFQNVTKRKAELEFENSNLKSQAQKFEMYGESIKPLLKINEELEVGYREAVLDKKKHSIQKLDEQMVLNNRKVQALLKENSDLKRENSKLQKTTSNLRL
jgi:FtsZ-binding cell division protein ZapB